MAASQEGLSFMSEREPKDMIYRKFETQKKAIFCSSGKYGNITL
jgi:hypothetical protein